MITANKTSLYVVVFSWLVFFVSVFSPLTDNDYSYFSLNAFVFFVVSFLFFYVSFFSSSCVFRFKRALPSVEKVVFLFFLFLFFAVVFRVIDRFYLRAVDDIFSFKSYRGAREAGSNLASVLAGVFMPMVFVLFSCLVENRRVVGKSVFYIGSFFVFILFFDVVLSGSRGIMLILLCLTLGGSLRLKNMLYVGPLLLFFFSAFFMYRFYSVSASGDIYHIMHGISNDGYAYFVPVSSFFSEAFDDGFMAIVFFPIVQANQYLAHGFFEFLYTYSNGNGSVNGLANFWPQASKLVLMESTEPPRPNVYYTLVGSSYHAFGPYLTLIIMMFLGAFYALVLSLAKAISQGCRNLVFLSIFLMPFVNSFGGFDFSLYFVAVFAVYFLFKMKFSW